MFGPNIIFFPDTPFLRDHIWSRVKLFSETMIKLMLIHFKVSPETRSRKVSNGFQSYFGSPRLHASPLACDRFLRFTPFVTPTDLLSK